MFFFYVSIMQIGHGMPSCIRYMNMKVYHMNMVWYLCVSDCCDTQGLCCSESWLDTLYIDTSGRHVQAPVSSEVFKTYFVLEHSFNANMPHFVTLEIGFSAKSLFKH